MKSGRVWKTTSLFIVLAIISLFFIVPLVWIVASALRPAGSLYQYANPLTWRTFIPSKPTLENFVHIFSKLNFGRAIANSLFVSLVTILLTVFVSSMAGFSLAKFSFRGKNLVFAIVLITFMVPFESIVIPLYILVKQLKIDNTYWALILPGVANGLAIFLFRQFFSEVPSEIMEAARIDGASWFRIYWRILLPLSMPAIVTVVVMVFMFQWNSLFWPLVATHSSRFEVVQVAIASHRSTESTSWANLFSSAIAGSLPPVILFLFLQKYFVRGISGTGLKG
ncbi:MAG TPA: carbohydrate ABC transporter permease [Mesotoga infera]|jgi:ABC-type glycerol-3-phosphate transport system permease component|uniref:ABC-type sugar transport system, permease component n=1 Tax=Mesotoga infera TaxID=1236046 RepID=A0A7Z7LEF7_9BACT|nr:carbohydrate ABC transporter permease [Mesotoga infera]SSC12356.1 ABC-type sugar transport system, permease component [Mesotoga infera]HNR78771.1 carbohydrate ABC transporter permease [Mesotoga infera]